MLHSLAPCSTLDHSRSHRTAPPRSAAFKIMETSIALSYSGPHITRVRPSSGVACRGEAWRVRCGTLRSRGNKAYRWPCRELCLPNNTARHMRDIHHGPPCDVMRHATPRHTTPNHATHATPRYATPDPEARWSSLKLAEAQSTKSQSLLIGYHVYHIKHWEQCSKDVICIF